MPEREIRPLVAFDEGARLRELLSLDILDTPREERFDRYTRLVADIFDVPVSLISLVDSDRQWFKSATGFEACETPRDVAFCDYALSRELLEVPDTLEDPRFRDNLLVTGKPNIRFYAGAVLRGPARQPLGTLCVIDYRPRRLSPAKRRWLRQFALLVEAELSHDLRLEQTREDLQRLALRDALTGLPGPLLLEEGLGQAIANARAEGEAVGVAHVYLSRFEGFNSSHGRDAGNDLLTEVAQRLQRHAGDVGMVARLSGARFALVMPKLQDRADASFEVRRLMRALVLPFQQEQALHRPPMAVGVSLFPDDAATSKLLLDRARLVAQIPRRAEATTLRFYSRETDEWATRRHRMLQRLGKAVKADELIPVFQSFHCLRRGAIVGCEALARWHDAELGPVSPTEFIALAEEEPDLIHALTVAVMNRACREALSWDAAGAPPIRVNVNVSGQVLYRDDFPELVLGILERTGLPPSRLTLELTEQSLITDFDQAARAMTALRDHGIQFAIDDFGTGYSSLHYLRRLPLDVVKIDRSFVEDIATDPVARDLTRGILDIARTLGLRVVAEGIENSAQIEALRALDCDIVQGFLLARPMAGTSMLSLLAADTGY